MPINSELDGNPPLWVTRKQNGRQEDIYINNAKILIDQSNIELAIKTNDGEKKQVRVYIIKK